MSVAHAAARRALAALMLAIAVAPTPADAQRLLGPRFAIEPGVRTIDTFTDRSGLGPASGFNVRVVTTIPTTWRNVALLVGVSVSPFGLSHGASIANDPAVFYGLEVPLLRARRTAGWLALTLPVLGVYQFDEQGSATERLYEHDLALQLSATAHAGRKLLADLGPFWSSLDVYAIAEQSLTPDADLTTGTRDRFNPAFMYGIRIPIGK